MFVDQVKIVAIAGGGGRGCVAFRREKDVPRGGPNGGDGGNGGSVVLEADGHMRTLIDFQFRPEFKAGRGQHGMGSQCHGRDAEDIVARVPLGTVVRDAGSGRILGDLTESGQRVIVAKGGRGGKGNQHFATATRQSPRWAEPGEPGDERSLELELRLLADVGLVGLPNAGKSLLLSRVSAARPKVADYPFTTREPQLGVVSFGPAESFVLADLPGLLEGAHRGVGLGHEFLRHVSRTRVLVHMVDVGFEKSAEELKKDYDAITEELKLYDSALLERPRLVAANKLDMPGAQARAEILLGHARENGVAKRDCVTVSALTGEGMDLLMRQAQRLLKNARVPAPVKLEEEEPALLKPKAKSRFKVVRDQRGTFLVRGRELEKLVAGLDTSSRKEVRKLQADFERLGVERALARVGARRGDRVRIGDFEFEYVP